MLRVQCLYLAPPQAGPGVWEAPGPPRGATGRCGHVDPSLSVACVPAGVLPREPAAGPRPAARRVLPEDALRARLQVQQR